MTIDKNLKLGTRGSPLAMKQAEEVQAKLCNAHGWPLERVEIIVMKTSGDRFTDRPLSAIGGKGLFTKELEEGLYDGRIDFAVHSMKDVATILPDGMDITAILPREDVRDAFVSLKYKSIDELPDGAVVGTSSLRRKAQLLNIRPDLDIVEFRGTVGTRLEKLENGVAEATFLAMAGLKRLGREDLIGKEAFPIETDVMLPAVAQGAIGIEILHSNHELMELFAPLHDEATAFSVNAERAMLRVLDGSCRTPIAGLCEGQKLRGEVLSPNGAQILRSEKSGNKAAALGEITAQDLIAQGAENVLGS